MSLVLGKGLYFFRGVFFQSRFSLLPPAALISVCFLLFLHLFLSTYMCLPVPFPTVPARATSHLSPPLYSLPGSARFQLSWSQCFVPRTKGSILSMLVAVPWLWSVHVSTESSRAFINKPASWEQSGLAFLIRCISAGTVPRRCAWPMILVASAVVQDYLIGRKDWFPPLLSLPGKRSRRSVLEGSLPFKKKN